MGKKYLLYFVAILCAAEFVLAQPAQRDLSIEFIIPSSANISNETSFVFYDRLFKITNIGKPSGITDSIDAYVEYNATFGNITETFNFTLNSINSFKTSGTGKYNFTSSGGYSLCGRIANSSINDTNLSNNLVCMDVFIFNISENSILLDENLTENITDTINISTNFTLTNTSGNFTNQTQDSCNISFSIISEKDVFEDEPIVFFFNVTSPKSNYTVEYWVEDLLGSTVKSPLNSSTKTSKQHTPSIETNIWAYYIKARVHACENSSSISQRLAVYKTNSPKQVPAKTCKPEIKQQTCEKNVVYIENKSSCKTAKPQKTITSFYTLAKTPSNNAKFYARANLSAMQTLALYKADPAGTNLASSDGKFTFNSTLSYGSNVFFLAVLNDSGIAEIVSLNAEIEKPVSDKQNSTEKSEKSEKQDTSPLSSSKNMSPPALDETKTASLASVSGSSIYESAQEKSGSIVPYIAMAASALVSGFFALKKP